MVAYLDFLLCSWFKDITMILNMTKKSLGFYIHTILYLKILTIDSSNTCIGLKMLKTLDVNKFHFE